MRLIMDSLAALMLCGILAGVVIHMRGQGRLDDKIELVRAEVERFQSQIMLQTALENVQMTQRGYPATIDAAWFGGKVPVNSLLGPGYPWLEIAGQSQRDLLHPRTRIAYTRNSPQFWYNPYTGVVRARVPDDVSDATALRLYNQINGADLGERQANAE